jgi:hypothetical protein
LIGHDLKLNVMRVDDQFLDINRCVPESFFRFRSRAVEALQKTPAMRRASTSAAPETALT